jgi:PST family polysaccharide transporter
MNLIKTSFLNGIAVAIKMLTLLGLNKVLAVYVGPTGYAAVGQFQNAVQMLTMFASGAINTGVTKYTAEIGEDPGRLHTLWRTAGTIVIIGSIIAAVLIVMFSGPLSIWAFGHDDFSGVFVVFAATLILFNLNTLLLAVLNGKKEILLYVIANIGGSIFSLIITSIMAIYFGLYGALAAFAVYQSLSFFVTFLLCRRADWFAPSYFFGAIDKKTLMDLSKFTAMALTSAVCMPVTTMLIRQDLGGSLGWEAAGYWEAMWRLSSAYLLLVTTTLSVYYLPRLSELKGEAELTSEIMKGYKVIIPLTIMAGGVIYFLKDFLIQLLFTADFAPMRDLFGWQMVGDTLKIGSWILAYLILGKAMYKTFIVTEIFAAVSFVSLSAFFVSVFGLQGVAIAYALNYALYWAIMVGCTLYYFKKVCLVPSSAAV